MRCCWGISNALPDTVIPRLPRGTTYGYPDTVIADVLIVPGIDNLRRIWAQVKDKDVAVLVFDAEIKLAGWRIPQLDLSQPLSKQLRSQNKIRIKVRNPIQKLLNKTAKSFVSNFVTLVYKNRDPEKQAKLRKEVFSALWRGDRLKLIASINKKAVELITLLQGEDATALEAALQEIRAGKKVPQVAKEFKLSTFDINYIIKFMDK